MEDSHYCSVHNAVSSLTKMVYTTNKNTGTEQYGFCNPFNV